jgi:hypothetical protein
MLSLVATRGTVGHTVAPRGILENGAGLRGHEEGLSMRNILNAKPLLTAVRNMDTKSVGADVHFFRIILLLRIKFTASYTVTYVRRKNNTVTYIILSQ